MRAGTQVLVPLHPSENGAAYQLRAVETLHPGDWVLAHDDQPHQIVNITHKPYHGEWIGLRRADCLSTLWLTPDHLVLGKRRVEKLGLLGGWRDIPAGRFARAGELRQAMTPPERALWRVLQNEKLGLKFRRQHPLGPYIPDFFARAACLVVEVDGKTHATPTAQQHDAARDAYMQALGLRVMRFSAQQIFRDLPAVTRAIQLACAERVLPDQPDKQWRYIQYLKPGDTVYAGLPLVPSNITQLEISHHTEELFTLEISGAHACLTEVCVVHEPQK